ncbi:MAG: xanthine dehydrogenase family protein subunit M [Chloroflexi bacterium]|nr:MAG: xanthine dehydrogenase family protein subunit M [Chloroflexota bacterium]RLT33453.1 MAG: xanthine dehydrogenase family protein subunit M [Chloroflexota bacterium]
MIPAAFEYVKASSVAQAIALLNQHGDEAKVIAGGHSLLPAMKLRLSQPAVLIDIAHVAELKGIKTAGSTLTIGAGETYHAIATSATVISACPVLASCTGQIGDIQVRNAGTIGGALAHADPAADLTAVFLALGGTVTVQSAGGTRSIAADDLFVSMLMTALDSGELITAVSVPVMSKGQGAAYAKLKHPASRYAIVGVAAAVTISNGVVSACRVAVTGAGPQAVRQPSVEKALIGTSGDAAAIKAACASAGADMEYLGDIHASEDYRRAMVKVYAARALTDAVAAARA